MYEVMIFKIQDVKVLELQIALPVASTIDSNLSSH